MFPNHFELEELLHKCLVIAVGVFCAGNVNRYKRPLRQQGASVFLRHWNLPQELCAKNLSGGKQDVSQANAISPSSPVTPYTNGKKTPVTNSSCGLMDKVSPSGGGDCGFESYQERSFF
jgi:hypothetical protein